MSVLVTGSIAFDHIMVFEDRFANHILPDKVHILNVTFVVPTLNRRWGGCAGNIAYNLKVVGQDPIVLGTVGRDLRTLSMSRQVLATILISHAWRLSPRNWWKARYAETRLSCTASSAWAQSLSMRRARL